MESFHTPIIYMYGNSNIIIPKHNNQLRIDKNIKEKQINNKNITIIVNNTPHQLRINISSI